MPANLPGSCDENVEDTDLVGPEINGTQSVTLAFPGCPSSSTELCLSFEDVDDVNCQNSSPNISISKTNLNKVISNTCNDLNAFKEVENNLEISSEHCLSNISDVDKVERVTCGAAVNEARKQCSTLSHSLPMFACCSSLDLVSTAEIHTDQLLSTSPRRSHHFSSPVHSCSLNWAPDRKKVFDGGRDDNTSSCVLVKAKVRGRSVKYKPESRSFEDCGCSNAGITNNSSVFQQEFYYNSPPMQYLCRESAQGDSLDAQKIQNTGADNKDEELPKEDACENKYGSADLELPTLFEQEQACDFQETIPLSLGTSSPQRSPPHFRPTSKDHRLIDRMFVDVLKLLVSADSSDTEIVPGPVFEDAMEVKDRNTFAGLNQTSNHEQHETAVACKSRADFSIRRSSSAAHSTSEEVVPDSPSVGAIGSSDHSEFKILHSWKDEDDEYECLCCKVKNQYFNEDINNCHYVYEDEDKEECSELWDCLHSESSSGGSSRESLRSNEESTANVQRTQSSETTTNKRPSVRELVRSLQDKFSACTNPRPSEKQSRDILPEWQFTSNNVPGNARISQATSSSHQDNLPRCHYPQASTSMSVGDMIPPSELSIQSRHKIKVAESDTPEESEHNDKICISESLDSSILTNESCGFRCVIALKTELKISKESNENVPEDVSLLRETIVSSDRDTTLLDEENKTCCPMKQFFQGADQSVAVSRTGTSLASSPVSDGRPRSSQDTTGGSFSHGQSTFFSISDSRSTGPSTPGAGQRLRNSNDNPQYEQISPERPHSCELAHPGTSTDISDKFTLRDKRWSSLLGASTCLNKVKATIGRFRSKSVSPLLTKLSSVFERMKDVQRHANTSLSLSGILEESSLENTHLKAPSKRMFENPYIITTPLQHGGLSSRSSQTTDEADVQSAHPVHATSYTTSGDDHPPIFCLEIDRTASVRKTDKQQPRNQQCCIVTRDSKNTDSRKSAQFMERNELTKIQQAVLFTNIDAVNECTNHSPPFHKGNPKLFTKHPDMPVSTGRLKDDFIIESTFRKPAIIAPLSKLKMSSMAPRRSPFLTPMAEESYICEDLRLEDTPMAEHSYICEDLRLEDTPMIRPQKSEADLDADVESYCVKELFGVMDTRDNSPGDLNPFLQTFSTPINFERELSGVSFSEGVSWSAPELSRSWMIASEAAHAESRLTEAMAIVSEEVHITRYPSFTDLTNLNSDVSVAIRTTSCEVESHIFLNYEAPNNVAADQEAYETLKLTDEANGLLSETATFVNTAKVIDASNLKEDKAYLNGYPVEIAHNKIRNCFESGWSQNVDDELGANSQADIHRVESNTTFENMEANSGVPEPGQRVLELPGGEDDCEILNVPKTYTDVSRLKNSVEMEQTATDNVSKDVYVLSPPCRSVSENSPSNDACGSQEDKPVFRSELAVVHRTDFQTASLPSPPDHSLSENTCDNDLLDTQTDQSLTDFQTSAADRTFIQSTSRDTCMTSPVHDKKLQLLRAAVTQDYSPLSEDFSLGLTSFGATSNSFSSGEKHLLSDSYIKPVIYSHTEDSRSSELSVSSLTSTDNPKEPQEADNLHLYAVDVFRDFRIDLERPLANGNSDAAVKEHANACLGNLVLESNTTSDCQFNIPDPGAASEEQKAPVGVAQMIAYNVSFERGSGLVENNNEDVINSKLSVLSVAEQRGGWSSDNPCTDTVCAAEQQDGWPSDNPCTDTVCATEQQDGWPSDNPCTDTVGATEQQDGWPSDNPCTDTVCAAPCERLLRDNNWDVHFHMTHPKTIDKVLKTHRDLPSLCTASRGTSSERDETACSDEAEEKSLNKQPKKIRWLDSDNCVIIVPPDSADPGGLSDPCCSGHGPHMDSEKTTPQIDTALEPLVDADDSSSDTTR